MGLWAPQAGMEGERFLDGPARWEQRKECEGGWSLMTPVLAQRAA